MNINKPYRPNLKIFVQKVLDETKNIEIKQYKGIFPYYEFYPTEYETISLKTNNKFPNYLYENILKDKIDLLKWDKIILYNSYITTYNINENKLEFELKFDHIEYET